MPQHKGKEAEIEAIMRSYATLVYPEGENQPLGAFNPERIAKVQASMSIAGSALWRRCAFGGRVRGTQVHGRLWIKRARKGNAPLSPDAFGMSFGYTYI